MAVQIFIHEPGIGLVDQTGRIAINGSLAQVYHLIRGSKGSGQIDFDLYPGDTYSPTPGSLVVIHDTIASVDHIVFRGSLVVVERTWTDRGNTGSYRLTLTLVTLEAMLDQVQLDPWFFAKGSTPGDIVTFLFNNFVGSLPITLGTVQAGAPLLGDMPIYPTDTLGSVISALATQAGFVWGINQSDGTLYFQAETTTAAPFTVTKWLLETGDFKQDQSDYRNRQSITINYQALMPDFDFYSAGASGNRTIFLRFRMDQVYQAFLTSATPGTVTGSFTGIPSPGDTVTINGPGETSDPYTWVATLDNTVRRQVKIGATKAACAQNLVDAINAQPNIPFEVGGRSPQGSTYSWPTWANQVAQAAFSGASPPGLILSANLPGIGGNSISVSHTGTAFSWGNPTLTGGTDGLYTELQVGLYSSGAGAGVPGTDVQYTVGGSAIFLNASVISTMNLLILYYRLGGNTITVEDTPAVAERAVIEGSSGLHTANITDQQQFDPFTAYQEALAYLTAYETIPKWLQFKIDQPQAAPLSTGQLLTVTIASPPDAPTLINQNYMVQEIQAEYVPGESKLPEPWGHFRYQVTCISVPEIQTFVDHWHQPFKLTPPTPPPPINAQNPPSSTPTLKPTTQGSPGTGAPQQGQPTGSAGQQIVQEQLGLFVENSGNDLVMATASTVSSASYAFQSSDVGKVLVINSGTAGWTSGNYTITSVSAGIATISGSPASSGATGGPWGTGTPGVYVFTWVPAISQYTNNQVALVIKLTPNGDSPLTHTAHKLTPFTYDHIGY